MVEIIVNDIWEWVKELERFWVVWNFEKNEIFIGFEVWWEHWNKNNFGSENIKKKTKTKTKKQFCSQRSLCWPLLQRSNHLNHLFFSGPARFHDGSARLQAVWAGSILVTVLRQFSSVSLLGQWGNVSVQFRFNKLVS